MAISREKQSKLGHKEDHDGLAFNFVTNAAIFLCFRQHEKLNLRSTFQIHKSGPQDLQTRGKKSEGSLASETSKQEDYVVETEPLEVPDGKALDESKIKDNREISDMLETFKHESFNSII